MVENNQIRYKLKRLDRILKTLYLRQRYIQRAMLITRKYYKRKKMLKKDKMLLSFSKLNYIIQKIPYELLIAYQCSLGGTWTSITWASFTMNYHILAIRNDIHILNLNPTLIQIRKAVGAVFNRVLKRGSFLVYANYKNSFTFSSNAVPYSVTKWVPGLLSNYKNVIKDIWLTKKSIQARQENRINKKYIISGRLKDKAFNAESQLKIKAFKKAMQFVMNRKYSYNVVKYLSNSFSSFKVPSIVFSASNDDNDVMINDCVSSGIPIVHICDISSSYFGIGYPIVANQKSVSFVSLILDVLAESSNYGLISQCLMYSAMKNPKSYMNLYTTPTYNILSKKYRLKKKTTKKKYTITNQSIKQAIKKKLKIRLKGRELERAVSYGLKKRPAWHYKFYHKYSEISKYYNKLTFNFVFDYILGTYKNRNYKKYPQYLFKPLVNKKDKISLSITGLKFFTRVILKINKHLIKKLKRMRKKVSQKGVKKGFFFRFKLINKMYKKFFYCKYVIYKEYSKDLLPTYSQRKNREIVIKKFYIKYNKTKYIKKNIRIKRFGRYVWFYLNKKRKNIHMQQTQTLREYLIDSLEKINNSSESLTYSLKRNPLKKLRRRSIGRLKLSKKKQFKYKLKFYQ